MSNIAIYPGSFDPFTNGHLDMVIKGSKLFDKVIVLISRNAGKSQASFTATERMLMIQSAIKGLDNVVIDILDGLLADYVRARTDEAHEVVEARLQDQTGKSSARAHLKAMDAVGHLALGGEHDD